MATCFWTCANSSAVNCPGLFQHRLAYTDLADVMQLARESNRLDLLVRQFHFAPVPPPWPRHGASGPSGTDSSPPSH
jgi:hypothetical protein